MKEFIKRVKEAYNDQGAWNQETFQFKILMWFLVTVWFIVVGIYSIIAFVTTPIWIVPYVIYSIRRDKR